MRKRFVLRVPRNNPHNGQYVEFHVFGDITKGWRSGWVLGMFPRYAAHFDRRDLAQRCIDAWKNSGHPLPDDVIIEEFNDGV